MLVVVDRVNPGLAGWRQKDSRQGTAWCMAAGAWSGGPYHVRWINMQWQPTAAMPHNANKHRLPDDRPTDGRTDRRWSQKPAGRTTRCRLTEDRRRAPRSYWRRVSNSLNKSPPPLSLRPSVRPLLDGIVCCAVAALNHARFTSFQHGPHASPGTRQSEH